MFNLDVTQKCLIAECWCPVSDLDKVQQALRRGTERSGAAIPSILNRMSAHQEPPTFNRTNKFTQGFQAIVDAYGVAKYQEVNPGILHCLLFFHLHELHVPAQIIISMGIYILPVFSFSLFGNRNKSAS